LQINAVRKGIEQFDYPIVQFANTVTSHFSNSANRWERYVAFCNQIKVNLFLNYNSKIYVVAGAHFPGICPNSLAFSGTFM
jgi:hypothetical protein